MASAVNLISYGASNPGGIHYYHDPADIEADWAAAQNLYGADLGIAGVGPAIYSNWPDRCDVMGKYGVADVLIDQIVRGGNSQGG